MRYIFIHHALPDEMVRALSVYGRCIPLPPFSRLPHPVSAHPDMLLINVDGTLMVHREYTEGQEILRENGFEIEIRAKSANHDECFHKTLGALELHVSLYYDIMQDVWFDNREMVVEECRRVGEINALGITDGYIYTLLHAVKHFLSNGLCVKQIMDVLLYEKTYKSA